MTSGEWRRRRDVKTQDREKSLSPLDKDQLKERCLERVRTERRRLMARVRGRRDFVGEGHHTDSAAAATPLEASPGEILSPGRPLSTAREILRYGLDDIRVMSTRCTRKRPQHPSRHHQQQTASGLSGEPCSSSETTMAVDNYGEQGESSSLMAIEEEAAYVNACCGGRSPRPPVVVDGASTTVPPAAPFQAGARNCQGRYGIPLERTDSDASTRAWKGDDAVDVEREGGDGWDDDPCTFENEEHRLLSPEEYSEMMQYIEEACREEDLRAEAEVLKEYEATKRLEDEAVESAISAGVDFDADGQNNDVLCPVCKRDYLLQAGVPSSSIVCACGFRLDTGGDRLGLEHLKQQLAETYVQHSASCNAEPTFSVEGKPGLDVLWSACDGCGFARVVL